MDMGRAGVLRSLQPKGEESKHTMSFAGNSRAFPVCAIALFWICLGFYCLMLYGGIRTADGEIVFRTGQALAATGSLALADDLAGWPGFALARGRDGRLYSVFAPGQSILMAPLVKLGMTINRSHWYQKEQMFTIPVSFTVDGDSLKDYLLGRPPAHPEKHALRFLVSFFTPVVTAVLVGIFFLIVGRLTDSLPAALAASLLLALATPLWSYAGTMFKEPLTMLWILLSFYCLVRSATSRDPRGAGYGWLWPAGLFIGLGIFTHVRTVLFVPFFFIYGVIGARNAPGGAETPTPAVRAALVFIFGLIVFPAVFGWLNYARFGHVLETGRLISPVTYGTFVPPWEGLAGLLISPGKGLFWFCPIVLAGLAWWPRFRRTDRRLSRILAGMIIFQWLFLACRSDWHGGFCLGPRFLLPLVPFVLIPVAFRLRDWFAQRRQADGWGAGLLVLFFLGCVVQQVFFCLGEPVSFYYLLKQHFLERGVSIIADNSIYFKWQASPLFFLLEGRRGPFLLQPAGLDNYGLFALIAGLIILPALPVIALFRGRSRQVPAHREKKN